MPTDSTTASNNNDKPLVEPSELRGLAQRIINSGTLGRSKIYATLLTYLVECSIANRTPKEIEIALDVMGRDSDFDVSKDSLVRVYIHNLRKKLESYFVKHRRDESFLIQIPKGQYTIEVVDKSQLSVLSGLASSSPLRFDILHLALAAALLVVTLTSMGFYWYSHNAGTAIEVDYQAVRKSPLWDTILGDSRPILVVLGDYYIFAEVDPMTGNVVRMVREFNINSNQDLENYLLVNPEQADSVMNLDLTYLPTSTAFALQDILPVLQVKNRRLTVTTMSAMNTASLKTHHIVYIGYISGLDKLENLVFSASRYSVGETYDEIIDNSTNEHYFSGAGIPSPEKRFRDYGFVSTFPTPDGTQVLIIAGLRDAGLMHTAKALSNNNNLLSLEAAVDEHNSPHIALEALYEVFGLDGMNFDASLLSASAVDYNQVWGGNLIDLGAN